MSTKPKTKHKINKTLFVAQKLNISGHEAVLTRDWYQPSTLGKNVGMTCFRF